MLSPKRTIVRCCVAAYAATTQPQAGLSDLDAMTFACSKAALNAASRAAAKAPTQGTYQFSYFAIVQDSHHATYEVRFSSNYSSEPELRYCVAIYCQQGWDPIKTKANVTLMSNRQTRNGKTVSAGQCTATHGASPAMHSSYE